LSALDQGADMIEIDVRLTADYIPVLQHDKTLRRTTNGSGPVSRVSWEYLQTLDAGSWFHSDFSEEHPLSLEEAIRIIDGRAALNIELKGKAGDKNLVPRVLALVKTYGIESTVLVTSFERSLIQTVKSLDKSISTGYIVERDNARDLYSGSWDVLSCSHRMVTPQMVKEVRESGKGIHVWTVDDTDTMNRLLAMRVDNIITNYPDRLYTLRTRKPPSPAALYGVYSHGVDAQQEG
jgi:glycerophosphoryl diester phosphodiesterase